MDSYQNPVGPPDPFDKYRIEPAGEKQRKEDFSKEEEGKEPKQGKMGRHFLQALQKMVNLFLDRYSSEPSKNDQMKNNLLLLKEAFESLKTEDLSEEIEFLNELSTIWNQTIEESIRFESEKGSLKFKTLVKKISHYPENQPHTFGYYLSEYAGQKWVPFPYIDLIRKIHKEHQKNPSSSPLSQWLLLIDEILAILEMKSS